VMSHAPEGGHAHRSSQLVGQAGAGNHDRQVTSKARRGGQIMVESQRGHRHAAWWSSTQEHRNDTHRS
jgi:hypothetical protein